MLWQLRLHRHQPHAMRELPVDRVEAVMVLQEHQRFKKFAWSGDGRIHRWAHNRMLDHVVVTDHVLAALDSEDWRDRVAPNLVIERLSKALQLFELFLGLYQPKFQVLSHGGFIGMCVGPPLVPGPWTPPLVVSTVTSTGPNGATAMLEIDFKSLPVY